MMPLPSGRGNGMAKNGADLVKPIELKELAENRMKRPVH